MAYEDLPPLHRVRPGWWDEAACLGVGPAAFLATQRGRVWPEAQALCSVCLVQPVCLARGWDEEYTVHAGLAPVDRDRLRARGFAPEPCPGGCGQQVVRIGGQAVCGTSGCVGARILAAA